MAKPGRRPAPHNLKLLKGTKDRHASAKPSSAVPGIPDPPECLDPIAPEEWARIVPTLAADGRLTSCDGSAIALYCMAYSRRERARKEVESIGMLTDTAAGGWKANPAVAMVASAERDMARLLMEFGATPASRSRISTPPEGLRDELADFLARRA